MADDDIVKLSHGAGGVLTKKLVERVFLKHFRNELLLELGDSAVFSAAGQRFAFTTDSYVVSPLFFPGGDIGKLAVTGTINDLVVVGARPRYISAGYIIEEGFPLESLERIAASMSETAKKANIELITADTKVVERGSADGIFINTAGIGEVNLTLSPNKIKPGDIVVVTGTVGDHGMAVLLARKRDELNFETSIVSDCAPLHELLIPIYEEFGDGIHWVRDATRGGLMTILNEALLANRQPLEIILNERSIPVNPEVSGVCELLGLDPFYLANEGKAVMVVDSQVAPLVLTKLKSHPLGINAAVIGKVKEGDGKVYVETVTGGLRIADSLLDDPVPRIC